MPPPRPATAAPPPLLFAPTSDPAPAALRCSQAAAMPRTKQTARKSTGGARTSRLQCSYHLNATSSSDSDAERGSGSAATRFEGAGEASTEDMAPSGFQWVPDVEAVLKAAGFQSSTEVEMDVERGARLQLKKLGAELQDANALEAALKGGAACAAESW